MVKGVRFEWVLWDLYIFKYVRVGRYGLWSKFENLIVIEFYLEVYRMQEIVGLWRNKGFVLEIFFCIRDQFEMGEEIRFIIWRDVKS